MSGSNSASASHSFKSSAKSNDSVLSSGGSQFEEIKEKSQSQEVKERYSFTQHLSKPGDVIL